MEIDKGFITNATTGIMSKLTRLNLDQDNLVDTAQEALIEKARDIIRQACVKNNEFQFTAQDEKLLLKTLEENNFIIPGTPYLIRELEENNLLISCSHFVRLQGVITGA
ncbi:MAG: hypothetical protein U9N77_04150 [Thermodesulfobacteriota bacterium]|nr:hypothetical protein [Thermodesulfobacteriota bacterium]